MFLGLLADVFGQRMWLLDRDQAFKKEYALWSVKGNAGFRSSLISNQMATKFIQGGKLDGEHIQDLVKSSQALERIGANATFSSTFYAFADSLLGQSAWGWQLNVGSNIEAGIVLSRDAFQLAFQGNKPFAGASADLSGFSYEQFTYQQFGVGLFHKPTMSGFTMSLVIGQEYQRIDIREGALFTSLIGDSLHLGVEGSWQYTDSTRRKPGYGNGIGFALNGIWNVPLPDKQGNFSIEIHDLGVLFWNQRSATYNVDTEFAYTGVDINDLMIDGNPVQDIESLRDSLKLQPEYAAFSTALPGWGRIRFMKRFNQKNVMELGITVKPQLAYVPLLHGGIFQYVNSRTLVGATFDVGGYGRFRVGAELEKWVGNRLFLKLGTDDIAGLILNDLKGRALYLQTAFLIRKKK